MMRKLIAPILGFMFVEFIGWFSGIDIFSRNSGAAVFLLLSVVFGYWMSFCPHLPEKYHLFNLF